MVHCILCSAAATPTTDMIDYWMDMKASQNVSRMTHEFSMNVSINQTGSQAGKRHFQKIRRMRQLDCFSVCLKIDIDFWCVRESNQNRNEKIEAPIYVSRENRSVKIRKPKAKKHELKQKQREKTSKRRHTHKN